MFGNRFSYFREEWILFFSTQRRFWVTGTVTQEGRAYGVFNGGVVFSDRFSYITEGCMVFLKEKRYLATGSVT